MGNPPENSTIDNSGLAAKLLRIYWPLLLAGLLFVVAQWPVLADWWWIWNSTDSYYSHGILVPFIAGFMMWVKRRELAQTKLGPCWYGLPVLLLFLPIHTLGLLLGLRVLHGIAFLVAIYGIILMMLGWKATRILFIPVLFTITMIPLAIWALDNATGRYQIISTTVAAKILQLTTQADVTQYGNTIEAGNLPELLIVGMPCSGLRLLISLVTFSWFFVYLAQAARWKKAILMALSFPLSILVNSVRITMIGYVGMWTYSGSAMHKFHNYSGYISLVICFALLFGIAKLMRFGALEIGATGEADVVRVKQPPGPVGGALAGTITFLVLAVAAVFSTCVTPLYDLPKGKLDRAAIPMAFGNWSGRDLPVGDATLKYLYMGDLLRRSYVDQDSGRSVEVFLDVSVDILAFHDPHLCLPSSGSPVTEDKIITIKLDKPEPGTIQATVLQASDGTTTMLVIYWYMWKSKSLPKTDNVAEVNRANKASDLWRLVRHPADLNQIRNDIKNRQFTWYRFSTEMTDETSDQQALVQFIRDFVERVDTFGK